MDRCASCRVARSSRRADFPGGAGVGGGVTTDPARGQCWSPPYLGRVGRLAGRPVRHDGRRPGSLRRRVHRAIGAAVGRRGAALAGGFARRSPGKRRCGGPPGGRGWPGTAARGRAGSRVGPGHRGGVLYPGGASWQAAGGQHASGRGLGRGHRRGRRPVAARGVIQQSPSGAGLVTGVTALDSRCQGLGQAASYGSDLCLGCGRPKGGVMSGSN